MLTKAPFLCSSALVASALMALPAQSAPSFEPVLTRQIVVQAPTRVAQYQVLDDRIEEGRRSPSSAQRAPRLPASQNVHSEELPVLEAEGNDSEQGLSEAIQPSVNETSSDEGDPTREVTTESTELPISSELSPVSSQALEKDSDVVPNVDPEYAISVFKSSGGRLSVQGTVADASIQQQLSNAIGGFGAFDSVQIDNPAPENFSASLFAGLQALSHMDSGSLALASGKWSLLGYAASEQKRDLAIGAIGNLPEFQQWQVSITAPSAADVCRRAIDEYMVGKELVFSSASYQLTAASQAILPELVEHLSICPEVPIYVEGHTDSDGLAAANLTLSVMRAETVVDALIALGVAPSRLYAVGYGDALPVAPNTTANGKRQNRRIVFSFEDAAAR